MDAKEEKLVPNIRFRGFTHAWEQRKLGEIFKERIERNSSGDLLSVTIKSGVIRANDLNKKDNSSEDKSNYKLVKIGDIAYNSMRMWQGASGYSMYEGIVSPAYTVMVPSPGISSKFMALMFKKHKIISMFKRYSQGLTSDTWNLKFNQLSPIQIKIPELVEQNRIEILLYKFNQLLTLHERKLELLKELKKAFFQLMFPDKDETVPKLRFKEFDGEWKQRKLDEISKIVMGQSPKGENYTSNPNDYILVQGNADIKNKKVFPRVWTTQVTKIAKKNSIILCVRAPVGNVVRTNYDVVIGRGVAAIEGNEFIYQLLQQLDNSGYWIPISTGSTFESISSNDIKMVKTLFPNEFEQEKIGSILRKIDQLLTHQESKLEKLKQTKNFFLQKMFI